MPAPALIAILVLFVLIMAGVLAFCLIERRRNVHRTASDAPAAEDEAEDNKIAVVLFGAIVLGAVLAIAAARLIFFSGP